MPPERPAGVQPGRPGQAAGGSGQMSKEGTAMNAASCPPGISVANAPVSYGAFELTVGRDPNVPDGLRVLDQVAEAGYAGIDLGPAGYLGTGEELADRLAERGLGLAGAYLELPYAAPDVLAKALPELDAMLSIFDATAGYIQNPPPRPTLADAGSDARRARPGRSAGERSHGLDAEDWR